MLKKFITGLSAIMPFLTSYPMWVRIIVVVWVCLTIVLILSLLLFRAPQKENLKAATLPHKTPLYEKTKQKIEDFYIDIDRNKLTPWSFLNSGKLFEVKDYYDKSIRYQGVEFEGTPRNVFWGNFIEPFLEHGITNILEQVASEAKESNLAPEPCIIEAVNLLDSLITRVYYRMAKIDQNLRGKGDPKSVKQKDVSQEIEKMVNYLQQQQKSITEIVTSQSTYSQREKWYQNRTIQASLIGAIALILVSCIGWYIYSNNAGNKAKISAYISKDGTILRSKSFPWSIRKTKDEDGNTLYSIEGRRGDPTALSVFPDNPIGEYSVYESYGGMVIKFTCAEEKISNFKVEFKY